MKNRILNILKESTKALTIEQIKAELNLREEDDISKVLQDLADNYDIYITTTGKIMDINKSPYRKGKIVSGSHGSGTATVNGETFFITKENLGEAVDGDTVLLSPIYTKNKRSKEAMVVEVLSRDLDTVIGEVYHVDEQAFLKTDNFKLKKLNISLPDTREVDGTKVIVKLEPQTDNNYFGTVVKKLGYKNDPGVDIQSIAFRYGFEKDYSDEEMAEVMAMPDQVEAKDFSGRLDLRDLQIFTIDGKDTKDIDDAISVKELENGHFIVGVHIADVTHYVREGSKTDQDAFKRGTSGYFANSVYPMLPQKLSNGICSLNPGVDRLTMSVFAEIDQEGKIVDSYITPSVIRSRKQMNYDDVNQVLLGHKVSGYEEYEKSLNKMLKVSETQIMRRKNKGALDLDDKELKIIVDDNGTAVDFAVRKSGMAEHLIESFMLIANQVAPAKLSQLDVPCIYRVHDKPSMTSLDKWMKLYKMMGYTYNKNYDNSCLAVQSLLDETRDKEERRVLQLYFLRSLMKAVYSAENIGHSGLAMSEYAQFTSPIRRYSDDILHRLLKQFYMVGEKYQRESTRWDQKLQSVYPNIVRYHSSKAIKPEFSVGEVEAWKLRLPEMAAHVSNREQNEVDCERAVMKMKTAEYMQNHRKEEYEGTVTGTSENGLFIELDNMMNGLIPVSDLGGNFTYNQSTMSLEDKKQQKSYHIGDRLLVSVAYADKDKGFVNFHFVKPIRQVQVHDIYQEAYQKIKSYKPQYHTKRPYNPRKHK